MQFYLIDKEVFILQYDLEELMEVCASNWNGIFLEKFFHKNTQDDILPNEIIRSLMKEKMSCVEEWADNLYREM